MAETKVVITGEDRTGPAVASVIKGVDGLMGKFALLAGGLGIAAVAAKFAELTKSQIDYGDQLNKTSQKIGIAVEQLSAYQYGAKLANVGNEELTSGLTRLAANMQDAAINKTGEAARTFKALGISIYDANGKLRDTGSMFEQLSARFHDAADGTSKTAAAVKLLGRSGADLIPLMNNLRESTDEAKRVGAVVSTQFAQSAEQFNDSMARMSESSGRLARSIASQVLPGLNHLIETILVMKGEQESLSLGTLEADLGALQVRYAQLNEEKKRAIVIGDFSRTGLAEEIADTVVRIDQLEQLIQKEKNLQAVRLGGAAGGGGDLPQLPMMAEDDSKDQKRWAENYQQYTTHLQSKLEALDASNMSEDELTQLHVEQQRALVWEGYNNDLMDKLQFNARMEAITEQSENKKLGIKKRYKKLDLESAGAFFGTMSLLMQTHNKKQFEIGKKAAIADTAIKTFQMAVGAYNALSSIYLVGPVLGALAAAAAIAYGSAQIQSIQSQQFEGGGGVGGGGAVPTFNASPSTGLPAGSPGGDTGLSPPEVASQGQQQLAPREVHIHVTGDGIMTQDFLRNVFIPQLNEAVGDGVTLIASPT